MVACQREDELEKLKGLETKQTPEEIKSMASLPWNDINTVPLENPCCISFASAAGATQTIGEYGDSQVPITQAHILNGRRMITVVLPEECCQSCGCRGACTRNAIFEK